MNIDQRQIALVAYAFLLGYCVKWYFDAELDYQVARRVRQHLMAEPMPFPEIVLAPAKAPCGCNDAKPKEPEPHP